MEINRIANNVDFIKKIILSIDPDEENYTLNYSNFRYTFQKELERSGDPSAALEIASEKLKKTIERRKQVFLKDQDVIEKRKQVFLKDPDVIKKTPKKEKPERGPSITELSKEQTKFRNENEAKRRQEILDLLKVKSGLEDEETLKILYKKFIGVKNSRNLSDDSAAERVIFRYKEDLAKEAPPEETPAPPEPPTEEEIVKAKRIIEYLDPKNRSQNLELFRRYLFNHNINDAFNHIQDLIKYRQFLKLNGLPSNSTNIRIFETHSENLEKAKEIVLRRQQEGTMPLASEVLNNAKGQESKSNQEMVYYNGETIPLHRIVHKLYSGLPINLIKKSFATIKHKIFDSGFSIDEAIALNNKELEIIKNREMFRQQFPEDPEQAMMIFESYYIDEEMPFEQALERTKQDIYGNRSTTAQKAKYKIRIK